MKPQSKQTDTR